METIKVNQIKENNENIIDDNNEYIYNDIFDVSIIGGGFAGLSAALLLGAIFDLLLFLMLKKQESHLYMDTWDLKKLQGKVCNPNSLV